MRHDDELHAEPVGTLGQLTCHPFAVSLYLVPALDFNSMEAIAAAMASPQGQATAADLANFAAAGVDVMMAETAMV